jgi:peptide/nickel transport system permease protein
MAETLIEESFAAPPAKRRGWLRRAGQYPIVSAGCIILGIVIAATLLAPLLAPQDPLSIDPLGRLKPPLGDHLLGTDAVGRDVLSRTIYGGRVSLVVGFAVALAAASIGLPIGLVSGYSRVADAVLMRVMDGFMSIPTILLAIALMAIAKTSLTTVIVAITVVEVPRVVRLVRSVVLSIREQPYVEAAVVAGSGATRILFHHILPGTLAPLTVQATYVGAAAILIESLLSFLGAGTPPEVPSWGNVMAEGRTYFLVAPWIIVAPGLVLATTVLAINLLGDGLRDMLDPRFARGL